MDLFTPVDFGSLHLANRLVMAPLTRVRAGEDGVPTDLITEYYEQRASLGLIVTEGTFTSEEAKGFSGQPGIVTDEQQAGWARVAAAVHAAGGLIAMQVMHAGRVTHTDISGTPRSVAPSAIAIDGETRTPLGKKPHQVPVAIPTEELPAIVEEFVAASRRALAAGIDAVELHAANGYLLHEFLAPSSNTRTDNYGGSPENRIRFVVEVVTAVVDAVGADRVGLRISPERNIQGVIEDDAADVAITYGLLADALKPLGLAFLDYMHPEPAGALAQDIRARVGAPFIINTGFAEATTREDAVAIADADLADAVSIGRAAIANPDVVARWKDATHENEADPSTFYGPDARGYTDYPTLAG
ncbi:2,4-dienoyl-CoA reductase-like NADH-dependent reductase (Old Yellow Enzyme family) [Conyzicola lurida]|uniref:2,4-dienoyl-CoA reductase-like NADH-dependent reductase (Old Yellow Enzyme family) n=1 Tax=Conyzicola lurida TaxID=1172621 RepID=A0A841AT78_9MICO|nr:alkene reductase [Conyzicola lurida]MBB5845001.1 2,4-dienoyl-CoA reductase-like NADH-dependent reductase (Old Yellow Enzyme family) [Conyzicola lurida]